MASRDEVKALIDQLPDNLNPARMNIESALHPPVPSPKVEQIMRRSEEFQKQLNSCKPDADPRRYAGFMFGPGSAPGRGCEEARGACVLLVGEHHLCDPQDDASCWPRAGYC
jgi:hypothetical protein